MRDGSQDLVVVKVGGSLFDLPDLGTRLRSWIGHLKAARVLVVPGGGGTANVVRDWDRCHRLGEEAAHWLALHAMTMNARFLTELLPEAKVDVKAAEGLTILDAYAFARADEGKPDCLPHCWEVTSDAIAARTALVLGAVRLILLKSVDVPGDVDWCEASERGFVDRFFGRLVSGRKLDVLAVNLRTWQP
ncbi:MAG: hypothetical protein K2R98_01040 [Gemmataceae bacterium]|nr:hypothetical protein [Gemmataceae bacterium]